MSFSPRQQGSYRALLEEAWQNMCRHEALDPSARCKEWRTSKRCGGCAYCAWYQGELTECAGVTTTTDLDQKRDFEIVMSHFAEIAENIFWMQRIHGGDVRRLLFNVKKVCENREFDDRYVEGIAVKALNLRTFPGWERLSYKQVGTVLSALKSKARHFRDCKSPSVELLPTPDRLQERVSDPDWTV